MTCFLPPYYWLLVKLLLKKCCFLYSSPTPLNEIHSCAARYPLIPVVAIPSINNRWKKMKNTKIGIKDRNDMANIAPHADCDVASRKLRSAKLTGYNLGLLR